LLKQSADAVAPAEKASARQEQTGQARTADGAGNRGWRNGHLNEVNNGHLNEVNKARACLGRITEPGQFTPSVMRWATPFIGLSRGPFIECPRQLSGEMIFQRPFLVL
jgi:hypothetical protein